MGYDVCEFREIAKMPWSRVQKLLDERRIDSNKIVDDDELPEYVLRMHIRDQARLAQAAERAMRLWPHEGVLDMYKCGAGLGDLSIELQDLLEYLADTIQYYSPAYGCSPAGKLVPPFLTHETRWHCTRQGDWQCARLQEGAAAERRERADLFTQQRFYKGEEDADRRCLLPLATNWSGKQQPRQQ